MAERLKLTSVTLDGRLVPLRVGARRQTTLGNRAIDYARGNARPESPASIESVDSEGNTGDARRRQERRDELRHIARLMELEPRQGDEHTGPAVRDREESEEEDEGPTLYEEMMQTALQAKEEKKERQKKQEEEAAARAFDRKGFMKGGFLNRPKKKAAKKAAPQAAAAPTTGTSSKTSSSSATASAKNETVTEVRANPAAQQDSFRFPEVHESLHSQMSGFERTLSSGEWVTDGLKERIHQDPEIRAGMSHPRCQQAIQEMQRDPKAAQEKYRRDPVVSRFIMRWIALMGEHFTELGRRQEAGSSSHASSASSAPAAAAAQDTESAKPLITARETKRPQQRKADVETAGRDAIRQVDADEVAEMASKREFATDDDEVRSVLSNPEVVRILQDQEIQRVMEDGRKHPERMTRYLQNPEIRRKLMVLQQAGLIRFE